MRIVCLGDSFTTGPMVEESKRWTSLIGAATDATIINRGISGDTTSGMLSRLRTDCIEESVDYALIIGGANDVICSGDAAISSLTLVKNNYMAMIHQLFHHSIKPIIAMPIPCYSEMIPAGWREYRDFSTLNKELRVMNDWSVAFAKSFYCQRIDIFNPLLDAMSDKSFCEKAFLDGLHLSEHGHSFIADVIGSQLKGIL